MNRAAPGKLVVGVPYWLTTPGNGAPITTTASAQGLTIQMTATRKSVVFEMGDGKVKRCGGATTPWPGRARGLDEKTGQIRKSPTCSYTYQEKGWVTVRSTSTWSVAWSGGGTSGTIEPIIYTGETGPLRVTELETQVIR